MTIVPLGHRVIIKPEEKETVSAGGIILQESTVERPQKGVVLAVGEEVTTLKKDDVIFHGKYSGTEIELDDAKHLVMEDKEILYIIKED